MHTIPIVLLCIAEFSRLYEYRAKSLQALRTTTVQEWRFILYNCSAGEGSTKDEANLESLPVKGMQNVW